MCVCVCVCVCVCRCLCVCVCVCVMSVCGAGRPGARPDACHHSLISSLYVM